MNVIVNKWGNSLAVRIPKNIADLFKIHDGTKLEMRLSKGLHPRIILERTAPTLDDLLELVTPENQYTLVDWGKAEGNELL